MEFTRGNIGAADAAVKGRGADVTRHPDVGFVVDERVDDVGVAISRSVHQRSPSIRV